MNRFTMFALTVLAAVLFFSPGTRALAQQPSGKSTSLLCKISLGGPGIVRGFVVVTLSNLTTLTIPKGQTLFARKGNETIKFRAAEAIPQNGYATYQTRARAFLSEGDCLGWYE
jgi:hypothetical protein